jgi:hypothetical protein
MGTRGIDRCGAVLTDDAGPISAAFPRRTHQLLTNVAGRSCAAPLTAPGRKSAQSRWAAVQRSGKKGAKLSR